MYSTGFVGSVWKSSAQLPIIGAVSPIIGSWALDFQTDPTNPVLYMSPLASADGGATWQALSTYDSNFGGNGTLLPNAKYTLNATAYEYVAAYPACWCPLARVYVLGGHA